MYMYMCIYSQNKRAISTVTMFLKLMQKYMEPNPSYTYTCTVYIHGKRLALSGSCSSVLVCWISSHCLNSNSRLIINFVYLCSSLSSFNSPYVSPYHIDVTCHIQRGKQFLLGCLTLTLEQGVIYHVLEYSPRHYN